MGRPTKLTPEVQARVCDALRAGNYKEAACRYANIGYHTFLAWLDRGAKAASGPYRDFRDAVQKAEADAEVSIVANWKKQVPEDWRAARDFLARRFPERWGPKDKVTLAGEGGGPVEVKVTLDDLLAAREDLEAWRRERQGGTGHNGHAPRNGEVS